MKKINIEDFKYKISIDGYLYIIDIKRKNYIIKRIKEDSIKYIDVISIFNDNINIENYICFNNYKIKNNLNDREKYNIINKIFNSIKKDYIINDILDLEKIYTFIKDNFMDYLISDGDLALKYNNKNNDLLNIILLENKSIIGEITLKDMNIKVDNCYFENALKLLKNYLTLFKRENSYKKILK